MTMRTQFAPENASSTSFCGYVRVGNDEFKVRVRSIKYVDARMSFDSAQLDVEPPLAAILATQRDTLKVKWMSNGAAPSSCCDSSAVGN